MFPSALAGLPYTTGQVLCVTCRDGTTYRLLSLGVVWEQQRWVLHGYEECELGADLALDVADITEWVETA